MRHLHVQKYGIVLLTLHAPEHGWPVFCKIHRAAQLPEILSAYESAHRELFLNTGVLFHAQKYWRLQTFRAITGNIMFMEIG